MRSCTALRDISDTCSSKPGLLVQKIDLFHCQMQDFADGTPDDIEAPAPKKRAWGDPRFTPIDLTKVKSPEWPWTGLFAWSLKICIY
jgi:hypothetical protein